MDDRTTRGEYLQQLRERFVDRHLALPAWMERLLPELREWLRILYWVFFKPSALRLYLARLAPGAVDARGYIGWRGLRVPAVSALALRALLLTMLLSLLTVSLDGLVLQHLGIPFDGIRALGGVVLGVVGGVAQGVAAGVADGMAVGIAGSVALGMVWGVAFGAAFGMAQGIVPSLVGDGAWGVAVGMALGVAWGIALGVTHGGAFGVVISLVWGITWGVVWGVVCGVVFGVAWGGAWGIATGVASAAGALLGAARVPFWSLEFPFHRRPLPQSPIAWDELPVLPQRGLAPRLAEAAQDPAASAFWLSYVARHPYARQAVSEALANLLRRPDQLSPLLFQLLHSPLPYVRPSPSLDPGEKRWEADPLFSSKLVLAEAGDVSAIPGSSDALAPFLTCPQKVLPKEPYRRAFATLYRLLEAAAPTDPLVFSSRQLAATLEEAINAINAVEGLEEFHRLFRVLNSFLRSTLSAGIPPLPDSLSAALFPGVVSLLRHLEDVGKAARAYRAASGELARRDHLNEAQAALDRARRLAAESPDVPQPFAAIGLLIADRWGEAIAAERERLLARVPVAPLDDFYAAGPPLRPEAGRLFVGREEIFQRLEEMWRNPLQKVPVVLYGQRRMGKTSILYHLQERLGPAYIPVLVDLQGLLSDPHRPIRNDADLWDVLARAIAHALEQNSVPVWPEAGEPMDEFLDRAAALLGNRFIVLMLDEFEKLEQKIDEGAVNQRFLDHLQHLMQHRQELLLLLAGHHTPRERMSDYWKPLMESVRLVRVSYLDEDAARRLITDPWDNFRLQYSEDSIRRLLQATGRQPLLLQMACSGVIREVNARLRQEGGKAYPTARPEEIERALDWLVEEGETYYLDVWDWLAPDRRKALMKLAIAYGQGEQGWVFWSDVPGVDTGVIRALEERELLEVDGTRCRFRVELLRRWLAKRAWR